MSRARAEDERARLETILVVDDTPENLRLLIGILTEYGYKVRVASNGPRALASIRKEPPDLILLDIIMPDMDGYEVCYKLKRDEITKDIPILFISALDETIDKVKAFESGGSDYISKPFQPEEVLARVKNQVALKVSQQKLKQANKELKQALEEIKTLRGLLQICAHCKRIRSPHSDRMSQDSWVTIETYISQNTYAEFSHGICPKCLKELYPNFRKTSELDVEK